MDSESVCRIEAGSTNAYLSEDRVREEFLEEVSPNTTRTMSRLGSSGKSSP